MWNDLHAMGMSMSVDTDRPHAASPYTPTGRPTSVRHWIVYHNPDRMGYEFYECDGFSVVFGKHLRDLTGDVVWVIGRPWGTRRYFLDSRFRVERMAPSDHPEFGTEASAGDGFLFFPPAEVTRRPWFRRWCELTGHMSTGIQRVKDTVVLEGLRKEYETAKAIQTAEL